MKNSTIVLLLSVFCVCYLSVILYINNRENNKLEKNIELRSAARDSAMLHISVFYHIHFTDTANRNKHNRLSQYWLDSLNKIK